MIKTRSAATIEEFYCFFKVNVITVLHIIMCGTVLQCYTI